jgi:hypothetical protein
MAAKIDTTSLILVLVLAGVIAAGMCFLYCVLFCNMHIVMSAILPRAEKIGVMEPPIEAQYVTAVVGSVVAEEIPINVYPPPPVVFVRCTE